MKIKAWHVVLAVGLAAGALRFVFNPDTTNPAGAALFLGEVLLIFALTLRYANLVEGRKTSRVIFFLFLLVVLVWIAEAVSMRTGLLGGYYTYEASLLQWRIGGVPILVLLGWTLFGLLSGSVTHFLLMGDSAAGSRSGRETPGLIIFALTNGFVLLGIDLAVEWHFSGAAGFWTWHSAEGVTPTLSGIPVGNFLLWFAIGCVVPFVERLAGVDRREERAAGFLLRASPTFGYAFLLFAGTLLDLGAGASAGALACLTGFVAVTARLIRIHTQAHRFQKIDGLVR